MKHLPVTLLLLLIAAATVLAEDHTIYFEGDYSTPQEITETCLGCHEDAGTDILKTRHWNWQGEPFQAENGETVQLGKQNLINNYCIAVTSNWPRCTSCHISYGWADDSFDFSDPKNIDCLVCHDGTGTYRKIPTGAGMPVSTVNLADVAGHVGKPTRRNCGICHFDGGGGSGVKHGDLDESLYDATRDLDVHMGGVDMQCVDCHETVNHKIGGASHGSMATGANLISCTNCHEGEIHSKKKLNDHMASVACETCHAPLFARGTPTKTWWDWSKAGEDREVTEDENGKPTYDKKKGEFRWGKDIMPEYVWFNGSMDVYLPGESIGEGVLSLNHPKGGIQDPGAKITPFKVMRGKQPYDPETGMLIVPHLYGPEGYWKTFDWNRAAEIGMQAAGLEYSGNVDFVETEMYWPINHMIAPKEKALKCTECHGRGDRLDWKALGYEGDPMKTGGRSK